MKLSDDSAPMDNAASAAVSEASSVTKDVPGVDQLGADMPNGGGVVKVDGEAFPHGPSNGQGTNGTAEQKTQDVEPSDDEEEDEQPEAAPEAETERKDMYLDAVSITTRWWQQSLT